MTDQKPIDDEADERVSAWRQGLEAHRRAEGLWTTDEHGQPEWLPPDDGPGNPVEPVPD